MNTENRLYLNIRYYEHIVYKWNGNEITLNSDDLLNAYDNGTMDDFLKKHLPLSRKYSNTNELIDSIIMAYPNYYDYVYLMKKSNLPVRLELTYNPKNIDSILFNPVQFGYRIRGKICVTIDTFNSFIKSLEYKDVFHAILLSRFGNIGKIFLGYDTELLGSVHQPIIEYTECDHHVYSNMIDHLLIIKEIQTEDNVDKITPEVYMKYLYKIDTSRVKRVN